MTEPEQQVEAPPAAPEDPEGEQANEEIEEHEEGGEPVEPIPDEAEQQQAQGVTPEQWEKRFKDAEKAYNAYLKKFRAIFDESAKDYYECPLCADTPVGFIHPQDVGQFPPEIVEAVDLILGRTMVVSFKDAPDTQECDRCDGKGQLATGSHVPQWGTKTCEQCNGAGFVGPGNPMYAPPARNVSQLANGAQEDGVDMTAALAAVGAATGSGAGVGDTSSG